MTHRPVALVVDDEEDIRAVLTELLEREGLDVAAAADGAAAVEQFGRVRPVLVLLDINMPRRSGLEVLPELRALDPAVPIIILSGEGQISVVVQAIQGGAYDYLAKPIDPRVLALAIRRALDHRALVAEVAGLRHRAGGEAGLRSQMGPGPEVQRIVEQVTQVAGSGFTVLIQGETGTGKELVARALHLQSPRRERPFIALDCGAIPDTLIESELFGYERGAFTGADRRKEGHFELADRGTLFLDEIGNLPAATQGKLLRVLQERQVQPLGARQPRRVDAWIIAASNASLQEAAQGGRFRQDLYYRLNEFTIALPALRERTGDIPYLAQRFVEEAAMELGRPARRIAPDALEALCRHAWPGNVRELRNVMRQAVLRGRELIAREDIALGSPAGAPEKAAPAGAALSLREVARAAAAEAERRAICDALAAAGGNKSEAARRLSTDFKTLHLKMRELDISARDFSGQG
jgi:two-component system, NtrC family, response regulator HydG